jgi:hypothetical protein
MNTGSIASILRSVGQRLEQLLSGLLNGFTTLLALPERFTDESGGLQTLRSLVILGFGAILLYALHDLGNFFAIFTVGTMSASAALIGGGLTGFLFGIPRTLQQDGPPPTATTRPAMPPTPIWSRSRIG